MSGRPLIIAHRGASTYAPENTLAAFRKAVDAGADGIEIDVRLAADGVPVVIHDDTLTRTGLRNDRVADLTSGQLNCVDAGSWFDQKYPEHADPEFKTETVPTLDQVLKGLTGFTGLIYVELKVADHNFRDLTRSVCSVVRDSPLLPQIIIKSFKLAVISEVRCQLPAARTAALFAPQIMNFLRRPKHMIALAHEFGTNEISLHTTLVSRGLVKAATDAGFPVTVWTSDDKKWLRRCRRIGAAGLITNDPDRMLALRDG